MEGGLQGQVRMREHVASGPIQPPLLPRRGPQQGAALLNQTLPTVNRGLRPVEERESVLVGVRVRVRVGMWVGEREQAGAGMEISAAAHVVARSQAVVER